jgi:hypothetical protein
LILILVVAFAEVMITHAPGRIDEVERRPVVIAEATPDRPVVVDGDRVRDVSLLGRSSNVVDVFLECDLWVCTPMTTNPCSL